jgi:MFS family permease
MKTSVSALGRSRQRALDDSLTRLVTPVFAGFSLPATIIFSTMTSPGQPWHDAVLSLLVAATGLFMAGIQLSIGRLHRRYDRYEWMRNLRAFLTILGIALVASALTLLVWSETGEWWVWPPLGVLLAGGFGPGIWTLYVSVSDVASETEDDDLDEVESFA